MRSPEACLKFAEECLRIAKQTSEENARVLCDMSKVWMQEAQRTFNAKHSVAGYSASRTKH